MFWESMFSSAPDPAVEKEPLQVPKIVELHSWQPYTTLDLITAARNLKH